MNYRSCYITYHIFDIIIMKLLKIQAKNQNDFQQMDQQKTRYGCPIVNNFYIDQQKPRYSRPIETRFGWTNRVLTFYKYRSHGYAAYAYIIIFKYIEYSLSRQRPDGRTDSVGRIATIGFQEALGSNPIAMHIVSAQGVMICTEVVLIKITWIL